MTVAEDLLDFGDVILVDRAPTVRGNLEKSQNFLNAIFYAWNTHGILQNHRKFW